MDWLGRVCMERRDRIELFWEARGWEEKEDKEQRARQCIRVRMENMVGCLIRLLLVQRSLKVRRK